MYSLPIAMTKRKKTRQEKIITDLRRTIASQGVEETKTYRIPSSNVVTPMTLNYSSEYISHDLIKTGILTTVILALEILLFVLLRK